METIQDREIDQFFGTYERPERWRMSEHQGVKRRRGEMTLKKDCFAYRIGGCSILTETVCRRDTCSFYKTKEQAKKDRETYGFVKDYRPRSERP